MPSGSSQADVRAAKRELLGRDLQAPAATSAFAVARAAGPPSTSSRPTDNVVGLGVAEQVVDNRLAGELVYLADDPDLDSSIPTDVDGHPVLIEVLGTITVQVDQSTATSDCE